MNILLYTWKRRSGIIEREQQKEDNFCRKYFIVFCHHEYPDTVKKKKLMN